MTQFKHSGHNAYAQTISQGQEAYYQGDSRRHNPYVFHTTAWYAWDNGWADSQRQVNPRPNDMDLELEASLVAYGESVQR
jgi:hypothetical protein